MTLTKKALDVVVMDLRKLSPVADYFVICAAESDTQVRAIADAVEDGLEEKGVALWHREAGSLNWYVLDYVDVVLHVFHKNTRSYYNLEKLWGDAKITHISDDEPVTPRRKPRAKKSSPKKAPAKRKAS